MNKEQQFFQNEYISHKKAPLLLKINGKEFVVPYAYVQKNSNLQNAQENFIDDFFDAQQKDLSLYAKNNIEPQEIAWTDGKTKYTFFVPFALKDKNLSNSDIVSAIFKKAERKYKKAASRAKKLQQAYPDSKKSYGVSSNDVKSMRKQYRIYLWNKTKDKTKYGALLTADFIRKGIKAGAEKIADLTPEKLKRLTKRYALATLIGGAALAGGYKLSQSDIFKRSDNIENVSKQELIKRHNVQVFDESLNEIKTVLCFMENFSSKAFKDGKGVPTIGYGCTYLLDENGRGNRKISPVEMGTEMTMEEAVEQKDRYLIHRVKNQILEDIKVPLDKNHMIATTSFMYVIGPNAFKKSGYLKAMNKGVQGEELARYMLGFAKDKGVIKRNWFAAQILAGKMKPVDFLDLRAEGCYTLDVEDCCKMNGNRVWRDENGLGVFYLDSLNNNINLAKKARVSPKIGSCRLVHEILLPEIVEAVKNNARQDSIDCNQASEQQSSVTLAFFNKNHAR